MPSIKGSVDGDQLQRRKKKDRRKFHDKAKNDSRNGPNLFELNEGNALTRKETRGLGEAKEMERGADSAEFPSYLSTMYYVGRHQRTLNRYPRLDSDA